MQPGQKLVEFVELATVIRGTRKFKEKKGRLLQSEHLCESITEMHTRKISIEEKTLPASCIKICERCIVFNVRADKFYIKNDDDILFVSPNYSCVKVNEDKCIAEYLADCIVNAKKNKEYALKGVAMPRIDWKDLFLPIFESLDSQNQIVQRRYREEQVELMKKLENLRVLQGKSSDLIHNLGVTFTNISAGVGKLREYINNETVEGLYDNVQFALRQINSTGADYACVCPEMKKVCIYDILLSYIKAWDNFGYKTFDILPLKMGMSPDTKIVVDVTLFFTMLDCIFVNAHQHGFNKRYNPDNKILIEVEGVFYQEDKFVRIGISNNGNSMPANFTLQDFVQRGVVGVNSSQEGLGGDHICKIIHHFGGFVSIDGDNEWLTINILIPVYLTSNNTKFNDYEYECL